MDEGFRLAVAVLAAGASWRFGDSDKLCAEFRGEMLGLHVTSILPRDEFAFAFVIASNSNHPCASGWREFDFKVLTNPRADEGMGTSVALAARQALDIYADALMIALADMPMVPTAHFGAVAATARELGSEGIVVSSDGTTRLPPACFGSNHLEKLAKLNGDVGARAVLSDGQVIACPQEWLADVDTPEALAALNPS
ncbi:MAG: NTP transferase domain-containing protein [Pseudomonadota bacterium]